MKTFIKTLYAGEDFDLERRERVKEKLNKIGFYVIGGDYNTLNVYALSRDVHFEEVVISAYKYYVQKLGGLFYGRRP